MPLPKKPTTPEEWEKLVLSFIGSLTLCDHMGDVGNDVESVLEILGLDLDGDEPWDELSDLGDRLGRMGITTLYGTTLRDDLEGEGEGGTE